MAKDKTFFVNLKKEDTSMLRTKLNWIVDELESRIRKAEDTAGSQKVKAISRPMKTELSKEEIIENIRRWRENTKLQVHMCLTFLKKNKWQVDKKDFLFFCKNDLHLAKPELFLLSLTKKPFIREWTNINDEKRKASDYGDILTIKEGIVLLNPKYGREILKIWGEAK